MSMGMSLVDDYVFSSKISDAESPRSRKLRELVLGNQAVDRISSEVMSRSDSRSFGTVGTNQEDQGRVNKAYASYLAKLQKQTPSFKGGSAIGSQNVSFSDRLASLTNNETTMAKAHVNAALSGNANPDRQMTASPGEVAPMPPSNIGHSYGAHKPFTPLIGNKANISPVHVVYSGSRALGTLASPMKVPSTSMRTAFADQTFQLELSEARGQVGEWMNRNAALDAELARDHAATLARENQKKNSLLTELQADRWVAKDMTDKLDRIELTAATSFAENQRLEQLIEQLNGEITQLRRTNENIRAENISLQTRIHVQEAAEHELTRDVQRLRARNDELERNVRSTTGTVAKLEQQITLLNGQIRHHVLNEQKFRENERLYQQGTQEQQWQLDAHAERLAKCGEDVRALEQTRDHLAADRDKHFELHKEALKQAQESQAQLSVALAETAELRKTAQEAQAAAQVAAQAAARALAEQTRQSPQQAAPGTPSPILSPYCGVAAPPPLKVCQLTSPRYSPLCTGPYAASPPSSPCGYPAVHQSYGGYCHNIIPHTSPRIWHAATDVTHTPGSPPQLGTRDAAVLSAIRKDCADMYTRLEHQRYFDSLEVDRRRMQMDHARPARVQEMLRPPTRVTPLFPSRRTSVAGDELGRDGSPRAIREARTQGEQFPQGTGRSPQSKNTSRAKKSPRSTRMDSGSPQNKESSPRGGHIHVRSSPRSKKEDDKISPSVKNKINRSGGQKDDASFRRSKRDDKPSRRREKRDDKPSPRSERRDDKLSPRREKRDDKPSPRLRKRDDILSPREKKRDHTLKGRTRDDEPSPRDKNRDGKLSPRQRNENTVSFRDRKESTTSPAREMPSPRSKRKNTLSPREKLRKKKRSTRQHKDELPPQLRRGSKKKPSPREKVTPSPRGQDKTTLLALREDDKKRKQAGYRKANEQQYI